MFYDLTFLFPLTFGLHLDINVCKHPKQLKKKDSTVSVSTKFYTDPGLWLAAISGC